VTDQPTLHARLLAVIEEPASVWLPHQNALRAVVELHEPEHDPCVMATRDCETLRTIARELGIEEDHRG
jgi:hypothetical protein